MCCDVDNIRIMNQFRGENSRIMKYFGLKMAKIFFARAFGARGSSFTVIVTTTRQKPTVREPKRLEHVVCLLVFCIHNRKTL